MTGMKPAFRGPETKRAFNQVEVKKKKMTGKKTPHCGTRKGEEGSGGHVWGGGDKREPGDDVTNW